MLAAIAKLRVLQFSTRLPCNISRSSSNIMKFSTRPLTLLALSAPSVVSAWAPAAFSRSRSFVAAALFGVSTEQKGEVATESFRLFFNDEAGPISPWHDIPLEAATGGLYNMVVEIPKMTKPKMEVATKEANNPIAQDEKKGKLRDYHGPIFWNYGCLPQTWEDPSVEHPELKCLGDNDPVDVVEIGSVALAMGSVTEVKVLGVLAMIDDGELDWKLVAIAKDDPLFEEYNDIDDVPAAIKDGIREWFRWYKTPDGKPLNKFGFEEKIPRCCHGQGGYHRDQQSMEETQEWNCRSRKALDQVNRWKVDDNTF